MLSTMDAKVGDGGNWLGLGKCGAYYGEKGGEKQSLTPAPREDLFSKHGLRSYKEFVLSFMMSLLQEKLVFGPAGTSYDSYKEKMVKPTLEDPSLVNCHLPEEVNILLFLSTWGNMQERGFMKTAKIAIAFVLV